jgi:hypothetical protein
MKSTKEELVQREKQRRLEANARMREKVAEAKKLGICRCGSPLDFKPGTTRYYSTCPACREKGKVSATRYYREGPLPPKSKPVVELDDRLTERRGVKRRLERDGLGREAWWWFAYSHIDRKQVCRRWSVDKYGDIGAWRLALAQRLKWEKLI